MHDERDMLHNYVIPELLTYFSRYHLRMDIIDLRWGIDTVNEESEKANTQKILRVCFDEIERSYPLFIGFIGERYGWIPPEIDVENAMLGYESEFLNSDYNVSVTELEVKYALSQVKNFNHCFFFLRKGIKPLDISDENLRKTYFPEEPESSKKCRALKEYLKNNYADNTFEYFCRWDDSNKHVVGLEPLAEQIKNILIGVIEKEILPYFTKNVTGVLDTEYKLHDFLRESQAQRMFGRSEEINELMNLINREIDYSSEIAVISQSGMGKSTLLAGLCNKAEAEGWRVIPFWAGISPQSGDFRFLASYICGILNPDIKQEIMGWDYKQIKKQLYLSLLEESKHKKILITVDAVNQFDESEEYRELDWLNDLIIPKGVKIVYSCLPGYESLFEKRNVQLWYLNAIKPQYIADVIHGISAFMHKEMPKEAVDLMKVKRGSKNEIVCGLPIYISTLMELLCSFDTDDYRSIIQKEKNFNMSPADAIVQYLCDTIRKAGNTFDKVFVSLIQKSKTRLGEKFDYISALLSNSYNGISEKELIDISHYAGIHLTAADFSMYRRMFRMHVQQNADGKWSFAHAIIRDAIRSYTDKLSCDGIYNCAGEYFSSAAEKYPINYRNAIIFSGKCKNWKAIIKCLYALEDVTEFVAEEIIKILISQRKEFFRHCEENELLLLSDIVIKYLNNRPVFNSNEIVDLATVLVQEMTKCKNIRKNHSQYIAEIYYLCGKAVLGRHDKRAITFFEISTNIQKKVYKKDYDVLCGKALCISELLFESRNYFHAERYAALAYSLFRNSEKKAGFTDEGRKLCTRISYQLCKCINSNFFSVRSFNLPGLLAKTYDMAVSCGDLEMICRCGVEYLSANSTAVFIRKRTEISDFLAKVSEKDIGTELYLSVQNVLISFYSPRYGSFADKYRMLSDRVTIGLSQNGSVDMVSLYQKINENFMYAQLIDGDLPNEEAKEAFIRTRNACRKLSLLTGNDWNDKELELQNDAYCAKCINSVKSENRRTKKSRHTFKKRSINEADAVLNVLKNVFVFAIPVVLAIEIILSMQHTESLDIFIYRSAVDISETVCNILLLPILFYFMQMCRSLDKNTKIYRTYKKNFVIFISLFAVLLCIFEILSTVESAKRNSPYFIDKYFIGSLYGSSILSIAYFIVWMWPIISLLCVFIYRKNYSYLGRGMRYIYRKKSINIMHKKLCVGSSVCIVAALLGFIIPKVYASQEYTRIWLSYWGTDTRTYLALCWIPLAAQIIFSLIELGIIKYNIGFSLVRTGAQLKKDAVPKMLLFTVVAATALVCGAFVYSTQLAKDISFDTYGYYVRDGVYYKLSNSGAYIFSYWQDDDNVYDIKIPEEIDGYTVYHISEGSFYDGNIRSISLPNTINSIEKGSFANCTKLERIHLPETLKYIEYEAFLSCVSLNDLSLPDSLVNIGAYAFKGCVSLNDISVSDDFNAKIDPKAFDVSGIAYSEQSFKNGVYVLGSSIAYVDTQFTGAIRIPEGVTTIGQRAFDQCSGITELYLPESLVKIEDYAFNNCNGMYYVYLPGSLQHIGDLAFAHCDSLYLIDNASELDIRSEEWKKSEISEHAKKISTDPENDSVLPGRTEDGLLFIEDASGEGYRLISYSGPEWKIDLPKTHNGKPYKISERAFSEKRNEYVSLLIPFDTYMSDVYSIDEFVGAGEEREVHSDEQGILYRYVDNMVEIVGYDKTKCPEDLIIDFGKSPVTITEGAFIFNDIIRSVTVNGDVTMYSGVFYRCLALEEVYINGYVRIADGYTFKECINLKKVHINGNVKRIPDNAFEQCISLTDIILPADMATLGKETFAYCSKLNSVTLSGIRTIGEKAFHNCSSLSVITLGRELCNIGTDAFVGCVSMEKIIYNGSADQWASNIVFENEGSVPFYGDGYCLFEIDGKIVKDIVFNEVTEISEFSFLNYRSLNSVDFSNKVKNIGNKAFFKCMGLTKLSGYDSLEYIYTSAFAECESLENLPLGESIYAIGSEAFKDCLSIKEAFIPETVKKLGEHVFQGCSSMKKLTFHKLWLDRKNRLFGENIYPEYVTFE